MSEISFTAPLDRPDVLLAVAAVLTELAGATANPLSTTEATLKTQAAGATVLPPTPAPVGVTAPIPAAIPVPTPEANPLDAPAMNQPLDGTLATNANVVTDGQGLPWDARIHSSSKALMESGKRNGFWKRKRGVDPVVVEAVELEIAQVGPSVEPLEPAAPPAAEPTTAPIAAAPLSPPAEAAPTAAPLPAPVIPAPPAALDPVGAATFPEIVRRVTTALTNEVIDDAYIAGLVGQAQIADISGLSSATPEMLKWFSDSLAIQNV